jgi:predicted transcriptional regulator
LPRRLTFTQLKKYDIAQKIIESLADAESRAILFSTIKKGKTVIDLSYTLKIPLSSVYKKLSKLEELSLIQVEKWTISDKGRKFKVYKSRISEADITIKKSEPSISLIANK